jgi:hypothetical protein
VEFCFELFFNNLFFVSFGPQLQLDIIYQEKLFDDPYSNASAGFSLGTAFGYEHWFGKTKQIAVGVSNAFNFTFYEQMYFDYKLNIYASYRFILEKANEKRGTR